MEQFPGSCDRRSKCRIGYCGVFLPRVRARISCLRKDEDNVRSAVIFPGRGQQQQGRRSASACGGLEFRANFAESKKENKSPTRVISDDSYPVILLPDGVSGGNLGTILQLAFKKSY